MFVGKSYAPRDRELPGTYTITCLQKWHVKRHHYHLDPIIHLKIITNLFALQRFTANIFGAALSAPLSSMGGPFELPVQFIYTSMNLYQIILFSSIVKHLFFFYIICSQLKTSPWCLTLHFQQLFSQNQILGNELPSLQI